MLTLGVHPVKEVGIFSYAPHVRWIMCETDLSLAKKNPGIRGQQVQREIILEIQYFLSHDQVFPHKLMMYGPAH